MYRRLYFCSYSKRQMVIIETTFYLILIPGEYPGEDDGDDEMSVPVTFRHFDKESKHFGFLASVFPSQVVYLVNKVYCKALLFLQPLYVHQRLYFCSHSKRQMAILRPLFISSSFQVITQVTLMVMIKCHPATLPSVIFTKKVSTLVS